MLKYIFKMPKLIIMPDVTDIKYFLSGGINKSSNDESNKIRENVITNMLNLDDDYFNDIEYGSHWKNLREKFMTVLFTICTIPFKHVDIKHMGGMTHNYDFRLKFLKDDNILSKEIKLEFKHNNTNIKDLIQFLELYDKDCKTTFDICDVSYAEFYYDNYLDKYIDCDSEIKESKPTKEVYLKNVCDIKYKQPFFKDLYKNKSNKIKEKKQIANESIKSYLQNYNSTFRFEKITEKIKESQSDKVFLLWDCENFHTQSINTESLKIKHIVKVENLYFDVFVEGLQYNIRIRLNWGNNNGIANPRWKFTFINK
jgi:hypothetical protein